jgi:hypothetical protein
MIRQSVVACCAMSCIVFSTSSCTIEQPLGQTNQSNFTYPESRVTPLGNVYGEASDTALGGAVFVTGSMKQEAIDQALAETPNANVLIDYFESVKTTIIPLIFLPPVFSSTYSVQGVAAEAEAR